MPRKEEKKGIYNKKKMEPLHLYDHQLDKGKKHIYFY